MNGITLIALVITIIVLIILAAVAINLSLGDGGILNKAKNSSEDMRRQSAKEIISLKITNIQIKFYGETGKMPTLQILADEFCEDNDFEYVELQSKKIGSLDKIDVTNKFSIFTKLKKYPYEFEINNELQLASINGIKIAQSGNKVNTNNNHLDYIYNNIVNIMNNTNTIEGLLSNSELFDIAISINENVDYIISNKDAFLDKILNSESAVHSLAKNEYAKNKIKQNHDWTTALEGCQYAYESWIAPVMTSNTKTETEGTITITANYWQAGFEPWRAMDGKKSGDDTGYWWNGGTAPDSWKIEFPYKIKIKSIEYYATHSNTISNTYINDGRFYTDETKEIAIGNQFSSNENWKKILIGGIHENGIVTNSIYFYKASGAGAIGELVINADKFMF